MLDDETQGVFSDEHAQENVLSMEDGQLNGATTTTFAQAEDMMDASEDRTQNETSHFENVVSNSKSASKTLATRVTSGNKIREIGNNA